MFACVAFCLDFWLVGGWLVCVVWLTLVWAGLVCWLVWFGNLVLRWSGWVVLTTYGLLLCLSLWIGC